MAEHKKHKRNHRHSSTDKKSSITDKSLEVSDKDPNLNPQLYAADGEYEAHLAHSPTPAVDTVFYGKVTESGSTHVVKSFTSLQDARKAIIVDKTSTLNAPTITGSQHKHQVQHHQQATMPNVLTEAPFQPNRCKKIPLVMIIVIFILLVMTTIVLLFTFKISKNDKMQNVSITESG